MLCPGCGKEAGTAEFCPHCLAAIPRPAEAAPAPEAAAAAPAAAPAQAEAKKEDPRRQMIVMVGALILAVSVGFAGAAGISHFTDRSDSDSECKALCSYGEVPQVASNANWQAQIAEHHCTCNALPKNLPKAQPVEPRALPKFPEPEPPAAPAPAPAQQ